MSISRHLIAVAAFGLAIAPTFTARGQSLAESEYWDKQMFYLQDGLKQMNSTCGTTIAFQYIDKPTFKAKVDAEAAKKGSQLSAYTICSRVPYDVLGVCGGGAEAKKRVQEKIHNISCGYAEPRAMSLSAGTLTVKSNNSEVNYSDWSTPTLKGLL